MKVTEKYKIFRKGDQICQYGIYGLSRNYFDSHKYPGEDSTNSEIEFNIPDPVTRVMQAVITTNCNLKCRYCSFEANSPKNLNQRMSQTELISLAERFNSEVGETGLFIITGGEPELYTEAIDFLVNTIRGRIVIFTNGTVWNRKRFEFYRENDVNLLFSLDGDCNAFELSTGSNSAVFNKISEALITARKSGVRFGISTVVGDFNIGNLPETVEYLWTKFHPASIGLNLPHFNKDGLWDRIEEYTEAFMDIFSLAKANGIFIDQINRRLEPFLKRKFRFRDCSSQGEKEVYFPGGQVFSCVNQGGLNDSNEDWSMRIPSESHQCRDCYAIGICGGGCIFDGEAGYGYGRFDYRNCYFTRKMLEHFIWDSYAELGDQWNNNEKIEKVYGAMLTRGYNLKFSVGHATI